MSDNFHDRLSCCRKINCLTIQYELTIFQSRKVQNIINNIFFREERSSSITEVAASSIDAFADKVVLTSSDSFMNVMKTQLSDNHSFTVMVVDDDPINLQVLINLLSMENYKVIAVDNGMNALVELSGKRRIDLVITDWMMPEMSGLELRREIRERYELSKLPVLMLTARDFAGDVQTGFSAGINDFLSKPVDAIVLRARVRTLLQLCQSVQESIRSELAFLQAQIKPHFLYNALNTMISICPTDPEKATSLLLDLSCYLRSSFDFQSRDQVVTLEKELELVRSYIALEQARFGKRLRIVYDMDEHVSGFIPPLSIQPIVENAVRHGIMQKAAGGTIVLTIEQIGETIKVTVSDDGLGMKPERLNMLLQEQPRREGVGLINIHRRLISLYGKGLSVASEWKIGTTISLEVPQSWIEQ